MSLFKQAVEQQTKESNLVKIANVIDFIGEGGRVELATSRINLDRAISLALLDKDNDKVVYNTSAILTKELLACADNKEVEKKLKEIMLTGVVWETKRNRLNTETDKMEVVKRRIIGVESEGTGFGVTATKDAIKEAKDTATAKTVKAFNWAETIAYGQS